LHYRGLLGGCLLRRRLTLAGGSALAHDPWLDNKIAGTADQNQVLHIIAADKHELTAIVDSHRVDDRQAWQASAAAATETAARISADQPYDHEKEEEDDGKGYGELRHERAGLAQNRFQHCTHGCASCRPRPTAAMSKRDASPSSRISRLQDF
jgi:hypothetical protein